MNKRLIAIQLLLVVSIVVVSGCGPATDRNGKTKNGRARSWKDVELKDVRTGKSFKISDFEGKPVLLESFAVWCPTCKKQQDEIKKLHEQVGDAVVSVSVDTDPEEDRSRVLGHIERNDFDWRFAVDRGGFAESLVEDFGVNVVNAPSAPVVLINADQKARLLRFGVKKANELKKEIDKG